jgi:hypothetical protein
MAFLGQVFLCLQIGICAGSLGPTLTCGPLERSMERSFAQSAVKVSDVKLLPLYDCYTCLTR